jgi:DNA-binding transcriptional LysR family regulator
MALNGAIGGIGVALLPQYVAHGALRSGQLVQLSRLSWTAANAYYLRQPSWKVDFAPLQTFREWLLQLDGNEAVLDETTSGWEVSFKRELVRQQSST